MIETPDGRKRLSRGRPRQDELDALRARIEAIYLSGVSSAVTIAKMLGAAQNTQPIDISADAIHDHLRAIRKSWLKRAERAELDGARAELLAFAMEQARGAARLASSHTDTNVGAQYLTVSLRAQERVAKLLGVDGPTRTELSGPDGKPIGLTAFSNESWATDLKPREEARRLRLEADALELSVVEEDE